MTLENFQSLVASLESLYLCVCWFWQMFCLFLAHYNNWAGRQKRLIRDYYLYLILW